MVSNDLRKKSQCPHCQAFVIFDEIHTHTHKKFTTGKKKLKVAVFRCPECKRIAGPIVPLGQQSV